MTVEEFVAQEAALPRYPGACCVMADRWVRLRRGFSPLARYGRMPDTDEATRAWLVEPGGIAVAVNRVMRCAGFAKTGAPDVGDVGLILHGEACAGRHPVSLAILGALGWYSRNSRGLFTAPRDAVWKAWAI